MNKPTLREIIAFAVFVVFVGVFFVLNFVIPPPTILEAERRYPAKFPEFSLKSISSGNFMSKFDDYAADRFVFRDTFRAINSLMVYDMLMMTDMSGLYRSNNVGLGEFQRVNYSSYRQTAVKIGNAAKSLDGKNMNIYYSLIPDKSVFAEKYYPGFNLENAEATLADALGNYTYIRIADVMKPSNYYRTDLHWDQSQIFDVCSHLLSSMGLGFDPTIPGVNIAGEFRGLYAGQLALPTAADVLSYADIPGLRVSYLNEKTLQFEEGPVYDLERFAGIDPYDAFLRGPQPVIVLENDSVPRRELYLFRDSFSSSLAPLLACSYSKVTLIDLRYVNLMILDMFVEFTPGSDVLFIYGSQIFNNPSIIQA